MQKEAFLKKLGNRIKELRKQQDLSQTELAHKCGKDSQSLERVENGKTNPSAYYLLEIAKALKIPVKDLFDF
jgi:putative transcriptional regulator